MHAMIDTLQITRRLQNKGFSSDSAEELADILKEQEQNSFQNLATKNDINALQIATKNDILLVRKDMNLLEERLIRRIDNSFYKIIGAFVMVGSIFKALDFIF